MKLRSLVPCLALLAACTPTREFPDASAALSQDAAGSDGKATVDAPAADAQPSDAAADTHADSQVADAVADAGADAATDASATADAEAAPDATDTADATGGSDGAEDLATPDAVEDVPDVADVPDSMTAPDAADAADAQDAAVDVPVGPTNVDLAGVTWTCQDPTYQPKACAPGIVTDPPLLPGLHVDLPTVVTYTESPPSSGTHRPMWGKFGEYQFLPKQRWLHNLEHGAVAFLYHPCAPPATIEALRALAKSIPPDDGGPFRVLMSPYPDLPATVALVAWGHLYLAECVQPDDAKAFIQAHYRKATEDIASPGGYDELWIQGLN